MHGMLAPGKGRRFRNRLSPQLRQGLDRYAADGMEINHPARLLDLVQLFAWYRDRGEWATCEAISRYLITAHGWPAPIAWQVGYTWIVVMVLREVDQAPPEAPEPGEEVEV